MAKLRSEQLATIGQKPLAPIYLVSGDETLLVQEACDLLRQAAKAQNYLERELYHADAKFDWNSLLGAANNRSLFAEKKIIELRIPSGKPGDKGTKALQAYARSPSEDNLLLLVMPKLDGNQQRSKWFKTIEAAGAFVQIWPVNAAQLPRWIGQRLQQAGLKATNEAIDILSAKVEGNLLAAAQEVQKLSLLPREELITGEMMANLVADSARYDVFGLVDKALYGDARAAVKTLHGLRGEGTDATVVLWALARETRSLLQLTQAMALGQSFDHAARQAGIWEKRKPVVQAATRRLKLNQLQFLIRKANTIDRSIKGMGRLEPWDELLELTLNLAGTFSLSPRVQKMALSG